jgi:hypothetical protein
MNNDFYDQLNGDELFDVFNDYPIKIKIDVLTAVKNGIWIDRKGNERRILDLENDHVVNIKKMLDRKIKSYIEISKIFTKEIKKRKIK